MIGTVGSISTNIYQNYSELQALSGRISQPMSFDDLLSNGIITTKQDPILGVDGITALPTVEKNSSADTISTSSTSNSNSEMDLNKDGQVTSDEIIRYIQMQMTDRVAEELCADEGSSQMEQQAQNHSQLDDYKNKLVKTAYKIGDSMLDKVASASSFSFLL